MADKPNTNTKDPKAKPPSTETPEMKAAHKVLRDAQFRRDLKDTNVQVVNMRRQGQNTPRSVQNVRDAMFHAEKNARVEEKKKIEEQKSSAVEATEIETAKKAEILEKTVATEKAKVVERETTLTQVEAKENIQRESPTPRQAQAPREIPIDQGVEAPIIVAPIKTTSEKNNEEGEEQKNPKWDDLEREHRERILARDAETRGMIKRKREIAAIEAAMAAEAAASSPNIPDQYESMPSVDATPIREAQTPSFDRSGDIPVAKRVMSTNVPSRSGGGAGVGTTLATGALKKATGTVVKEGLKRAAFTGAATTAAGAALTGGASVAAQVAYKGLRMGVSFARKHGKKLVAGAIGSAMILGSIVGTTVAAGTASVLANVFGSILVTVFVFAFILLIINNSAFIVPPAPSLLAPGAIADTVIKSEFIEVVKTANPPGPFENGEAPAEITYTVKVLAKKTDLTNIKLENKCEVLQANLIPGTTKPTCVATVPPDFPPSLSAGETKDFTYKANYSSTAYNDSQITDTVAITADTPNTKGEKATGFASITIGKPPTVCPSGWPISGTNALPTGYSISQGRQTGTSHVGYEALDLAGRNSVPVKATHAGIVIYYLKEDIVPYLAAQRITWNAGYGNHVRVISNCEGKRFESIYAHLETIDGKLQKSTLIEKGTPLGTVGSTGRSKGLHLHYEFRPADPVFADWAVPVDKQPVIMKPPYVPFSQ